MAPRSGSHSATDFWPPTGGADARTRAAYLLFVMPGIPNSSTSGGENPTSLLSTPRQGIQFGREGSDDQGVGKQWGLWRATSSKSSMSAGVGGRRIRTTMPA